MRGHPDEALEAMHAAPAALCQDAVERCPDGFLALDLDGRVAFVNDAYLRKSGYSREELVGAECERLVLGGVQADIVARLRRLCDGGEHVGETRHVTKDGGTWPVEITASFHPGAGLFFAFHRDITRRKRASALLEARVEVGRVAVDGTLDEVMQRTVDAAEQLTQSTIGFFHFVDDDQEHLTLNAWSSSTLARMCTAEGKGAHYPVSQAGVWVDALHARRPVAHNDYAALPHKKGMPIGHAHVTRLLTVPILKGELVAALLGVGNKATEYDDEDVAAIRELAGFTMDVVSRKRAEEQLRASEERFRSLFETMAQGVVYQRADGAIESANPAAERLLGLTPAELHGRTSLDPRWQALAEDGAPVPGDQHPAMRALRSGRVERGVIGVWNPRRGARVWVDATATPRFRPGEAAPYQVFTVFDDLTDRRAAEEARLAVERREQRLQKLESLGVLAGGVAHDFNNLLAAIVGHLDLAGGELDRDHVAQLDLEGARSAADRATNICRQMLAYSGRGRFVVAPTTWDDLFRVGDAIAPPPKLPGVRVELSVTPTPARIEADASQLRRLLHNLVENAAEALGPGGGVVEIEAGVRECGRDELDACTLGEGLPPGRYATIEVRDRGEGMDAPTLGRIFDPFFSRRFTGRGLGMPEVLGIVRAHGGAVRVISALGRGTTVRVLLPCVGRGAGAAEVTPAPPPVAEGERVRPVLVVDDDETVRRLCQRLLGRAGFATLGAASGAEALEIVRARSGDIALVVLDVAMPGLSGEQVLADLRREHPGVPVLMSSGFTAEALGPQLVAWGADGFLQKPYDGKRLLDTVDAALRRAARP